MLVVVDVFALSWIVAVFVCCSLVDLVDPVTLDTFTRFEPTIDALLHTLLLRATQSIDAHIADALKERKNRESSTYEECEPLAVLDRVPVSAACRVRLFSDRIEACILCLCYFILYLQLHSESTLECLHTLLHLLQLTSRSRIQLCTQGTHRERRGRVQSEQTAPPISYHTHARSIVLVYLSRTVESRLCVKARHLDWGCD